MSEEQSTDDLEKELEERRAKKKKGRRLAQGAKKQGTGVVALLIAVFGAYEGYTNKEVTALAANIAAEAKVDGKGDRAQLVEEINALREVNAELGAELDALKEINKERYDHLREWLRNISRGRRAPEPEPIAREMELPPPPPVPVAKLPKRRPQKNSADYQQQVQQVLKEKGFK